MKNHSDVPDTSKERTHDPSTAQAEKSAQPEGASWQFYVVLAIIGLGFLMILAKAFGVL